MVSSVFGYGPALALKANGALIRTASTLGLAMVKYEQSFVKFLQREGIDADHVSESSAKAYAGYLRAVSALTSICIEPKSLHSERDVVKFATMLSGMRASTTINAYSSAMRRYVAMIRSKWHEMDQANK